MRKVLLLACVVLALMALPAAAQEVLLDQGVRAGELNCFPIQGDPTTWYYLPDKPHIVRDENGNPEFSFVMYSSPEHKGAAGINKAPGGGILHFLVAYDVTPEQVREAQNALARLKPGAKLVGPVGYTSGTVVVESALADPKWGFSRRPVGAANAPVTAGHKAAISLHLNEEGSTLLWESFKQPTAQISVCFEMTYSGYRNPVEASLLIDWQRASETMQVQAAGRVSFIALEVDVLLQKMQDNGAIKLELKGVPSQLWNDVQKLGLDLARQQLFENLGAPTAAGGAGIGSESPLDRLWKAYGSEWQAQKKAASLLPGALSGLPSWEAASLAWDPLFRRAAWLHGGGLLPTSALASLGSDASAASPSPEALQAPTEQRAKDLFDRAKKLYDKGEYKDALDLFEQSLALLSRPNTQFNVGQCHLRLGHRDEASAAFKEFAKIETSYNHSWLEGALASLASEPPLLAVDRRQAWSEQFVSADKADSSGITSPAEAGEAPAPSIVATATPADAAVMRQQATSSISPTPKPPSSGASRTPAAAGAAKTPVASPGGTPGLKPTIKPSTTPPTTPKPSATPKPEPPTTWGVIASFRFRQVERKGAMRFNLKQWIRSEKAERFAANLGDLSPLVSNTRFFRRVSLDDPVFRQREIPVTVDVSSEAAFTAMLNSVTVTMRKVHESGKETLDEVTISRAELAKATPPTLVYGWDGDNNRTRWLEYDTRVRWSYVGGPVIETGWEKTAAGALVLEPPLRPRTLLLMTDAEPLVERGVRDVLVEVRYRAGQTDRTASATVRPVAGSSEVRLVLYQDPQAPEYTYTLTWRMRGGRQLSTAPTAEKADIIYLDDLPAAT